MSSRMKHRNKVYDINTCYLLCLLPLIIFSYYKNGYLVYKANCLSFFSSLEYLVIPIIIVIISYIFEVYYYIGIKKDRNYNNVINSLSPYANLLCYLVCGPSDYLYIIIPLIFIIDIFIKCINNKFTINRVVLFKCILFIILIALGLYNNANAYEKILNIYSFNNVDSFLGLIVGEIGVVSNILIIISFIVLLFNKYYKKDIAITAFIVYLLFGLFFIIMNSIGLNEFIANTLNSGIIFIIVYVLTLSDASPVLRSGRIIYAILFSILAAIFVNIFKIYIGLYFIVLVLSIISPLINKLKISIYK